MHTQSRYFYPDNLLFSASSPTTSKASAPLQSTSHTSLSPSQSHSYRQSPLSINIKDPSLDHTRLTSFFDQSQGSKSRSHTTSFLLSSINLKDPSLYHTDHARLPSFFLTQSLKTLTVRNTTNSEHTYFSRHLPHLNLFLKIGGVSPPPPTHTHSGSFQDGTVVEVSIVAIYCSNMSISGGGRQ
jgi:hypothetical protein